MAKITAALAEELTHAIKSDEYLNEVVKIVPIQEEWVELYFDNAFSDDKAEALKKVCAPLGLVYHFMAHPTHIYILVYPYKPSN